MICSCSVVMAARGNKPANLDVIVEGASRGQVEAELGKPIYEKQGENGRTIAVYKYTVGNEPSAGRAVLHGAADVLTLGLWEVAGTPIELAQKEGVNTVTVMYDRNGKVVKQDFK